ncbi:hypothetical protein [Terriglobus aquaticus]|uniref:Uncharacterized protein n=1 Tax=Terriglobus aquaticus TaxID=940139 RepID=A0ABW9KMG4_9BACT|nr:hypothetical protein [Terriglobus aquaticus]
MKITDPPSMQSWYPTQAETKQTQRDQMAQSLRNAREFAEAAPVPKQMHWWTRLFERT